MLQMRGIRGIFLDVDPRDGLVAGSPWEKSLKEQMQGADAALFLVSRAWLGSDVCWKEFQWARDAAASGGKPRIIPLLIEGMRPETLADGVDSGRKLEVLQIKQLHVCAVPTSLEDIDRAAPLALQRLDDQRKALRALWEVLEPALREAGIEPIKLPHAPERPPFPGLRPLVREDAAIFFGREALLETAVDVCEELRKRRGVNFMTILGASGAGKSSFLRAGLLPRLELLDHAFFCLPVVRPGTAALTGNPEGLIAALAEAFSPKRLLDEAAHAKAALAAAGGLEGRRGDAKRAVDGGVEGVEALLKRLSDLVSMPSQGNHVVDPVTLVLPIDQGEELLPVKGAGAAVAEEAKRLRELVCSLLSRRNVHLLCVMSIRSDSFPRLQEDDQLGGIARQAIDLPPMPQASFRDVIEGPAEVKGLELESELIERLIDDASGQDALPLLAFVLRRLWDGLAQKPATLKTEITLADYLKIGQIGGAIEKVVEDALKLKLDKSGDPQVRETLQRLRHAFIPHLATVAEQNGEFLRRIARPDEIAEAGDLIDRLVEARILVRRDDAGIEVAHEAVLRKWKLLADWLGEARGALWFLRQAEDGAKTWSKARAELVAKHSETAREVLQHDRAQLWLQNRLDDVWRALDQVGRKREGVVEPLKSFIRPEFDRLLDELTSEHTDHARRAEIGDRLAALGERQVEKQMLQLGDLRPGVNVLTPERLRHGWLALDLEPKRRAFCERWLAALEKAPEDAPHSLPDIQWCPVPAGEVDVYTQFKERPGADGGTTGEPDGTPTRYKIERPFWVSQYPVTLEQFVAFTGDRDRGADYRCPDWWAGFDGDQHQWFKNTVRDQSTARNYAAQYVTWYQAVAYCRWLTARYRSFGLLAADGEIRLPFEAEWIQAATGGTPRTYPWGDTWDPSRASHQEGMNRFVAVGLYPLGRSPTGAMDMAGNLYEWCLNAFDDLNDPALDRRAKRATKGGSYYTQKRAGDVRWALSVHHRFEDNPLGENEGGNRIAAGIRLVCTGFAS